MFSLNYSKSCHSLHGFYHSPQGRTMGQTLGLSSRGNMKSGRWGHNMGTSGLYDLEKPTRWLSRKAVGNFNEGLTQSWG